MISRLLSAFARRVPAHRVIMDREGGSKYLSRWYITPHRSPNSRRPVAVFLHQFHRSDDDGALHSHPWAWSFSLILSGRYSEDRRVGDEVVQRTLGPLNINVIRDEDFHRVELLTESVWTLFVAGPKTSGPWCFWCRDRKARTPWTEFVAAKRNKREAIWFPDRRAA